VSASRRENLAMLAAVVSTSRPITKERPSGKICAQFGFGVISSSPCSASPSSSGEGESLATR